MTETYAAAEEGSKYMVKFRPGDTIVEVTFAIVIFGLVAVIAIGLMNNSVNVAQTTLEVTMARSEINAQAEALRFIHNAFSIERSLPTESQQYVALWDTIASIAEDNYGRVKNGISPYPIANCDIAYSGSGLESSSIFNEGAFIINVRNIKPVPTSITGDPAYDWRAIANDVVIPSRSVGLGHPAQKDKFSSTQLFPRILYDLNGPQFLADNQATLNNIYQAQGIWIVPVASERLSSQKEPEFYDFHIRTCWYAPGKMAPSTIATVLRLYNPEHFEYQHVW